MITFDDFAKLELKVGTVLLAEAVEGSEKLIKFKIDLGPAPDGAGQEVRQVLAGVKQWYQPEDLVGKQVVVVINLEPRKMMGLESQGMILFADPSTSSGQVLAEGPVYLTVFKDVPPGTTIR